MKVSFTPEAQAQVRRRRAWWKQHRDNTGVFGQSLSEAVVALRNPPKLEVHGIRNGAEVRRLSISKLHCFIYYVIVEETQTVQIVSVWGQEMAHQPDFIDE